MHHQYSGSVSPFQAKTGTPAGASTVPSGPTTTAAAAWSWVEKMLQETQRTSAPSATSVSMSTAVCTVMCSEPAIRAPASGWLGAELLAQRHQAGHLVLGEADLVAAELGEGQVGDLVVAGLQRGGSHASASPDWAARDGGPMDARMGVGQHEVDSAGGACARRGPSGPTHQ